MNSTIHDYQVRLKEIYGARNLQSGFDYLFGYLVKNIFRPRSETNINHIYIKSISYLFSIANLYNIDIQDCFLRKFPKICPYCLCAPCICAYTQKESQVQVSDVESELNRRYSSLIASRNQATNNITFEEALKIIQQIYPNNIYEWNLHGNGVHLVKLGEEVGELHEACCRLISCKFSNNHTALSAVKEEIADVFAWCVSDWGLSCKGQNMSKSFDEYYDHGCSGCKQMKCECKPRADRITLLTAQSTAYQMITLINDIRAKLGESDVNDKGILALNEKANEIETTVRKGRERLTNRSINDSLPVVKKIISCSQLSREEKNLFINTLSNIDDSLQCSNAIPYPWPKTN